MSDQAPTITTERENGASGNALLDATLSYARLGWAVVPMLAGTNRCVLMGWEKLATSDEAILRDFWRKSPDANVGIVAGASGIVVVDVDMHNGDGLAAWRAIAATLDPSLIRTPTEQTPTNGGLHVYYRTCDPSLLPEGQLTLGPGVELIVRNHCVVAAPSIRPHGRYAWLPGMSPADLPLQVFPRELISRIVVGSNRGDRNSEALAKANLLTPGGRNCALASVAGSLRRYGLNEEGLDVALGQLNGTVCNPPLPDAEVHGIAHSIAQYPGPEPVADATGSGGTQLNATLLRSVHTTDVGAAELFRLLFSGRVRYDHLSGHWYVWAAPVWTADADGEVNRLAIEVPKTIFRVLPKIADAEFAAKMGHWAASLENVARQEAMLKIVRSLKPIAATSSSWDADLDLLGCANGLLDLRTGLLRDGQPQDTITKCTRVTYDASANCPRWERFLDEVFAGNADTISFVRRAVGYSLTGHVSEQCLFLLFGSGCNGKSTFTNTLSSLLGDYAANTPFSTFEAMQQGSATNDIAALMAKRLVTSSEASEQRALNEARIKAMTGGDPLSARFLYREFFQYTPTFHIWLSMNELPRVAGADDGIWRRIRLIPFAESFLGKEDRGLGATLQHELSGILNWAVQGLGEWRESGLGTAARVSEATSAYRTSSDLVRQFMEECTVTFDGEWTRAAVLYAAFSKWCAAQGTQPASENAFGRRLSGMGYQPARDKRGRGYRGIRLVC